MFNKFPILVFITNLSRHAQALPLLGVGKPCNYQQLSNQELLVHNMLNPQHGLASNYAQLALACPPPLSF